jgi:hypothetical protein
LKTSGASRRLEMAANARTRNEISTAQVRVLDEDGPWAMKEFPLVHVHVPSSKDEQGAKAGGYQRERRKHPKTPYSR